MSQPPLDTPNPLALTELEATWNVSQPLAGGSAHAGALAEVRAREALYESTLPLQPLSYKFLARSWSQALVKTYTAQDNVSLERAQREFKECETDIVNVVGKATYERILGNIGAASSQSS